VSWTIEIHQSPEQLHDQLRRDVLGGLTSVPKELAPKYFYDERGCELFERITRLPEYYPTRAERAVLEARSGEIAAFSAADTLVELGSGTSQKTRLLLDACLGGGRLRRFVPFDVSEPTLRTAAAALAADYPSLQVHAVVGDFERHLSLLPPGGRRLVAFLGGTIGNLTPKQRAQLLGDLAAGLRPDDGLLLGTDLVKDPARLVAAYDDAAGVTAEFNRNVLRVVNRELHADFVPERFDHVARFDPDEEWVEMRLRARSTHRVHVRELGLVVGYADGEEIRTEISAKFRRDGVESELAGAGLALARWWTDPAGDFAVSLAFKE
jgi:L-histidine Nalpha-methyltransferase